MSVNFLSDNIFIILLFFQVLQYHHQQPNNLFVSSKTNLESRTSTSTFGTKITPTCLRHGKTRWRFERHDVIAFFFFFFSVRRFFHRTATALQLKHHIFHRMWITSYYNYIDPATTPNRKSINRPKCPIVTYKRRVRFTSASSEEKVEKNNDTYHCVIKI